MSGVLGEQMQVLLELLKEHPSEALVRVRIKGTWFCGPAQLTSLGQFSAALGPSTAQQGRLVFTYS